jgi:hypothetical protein
MATNKAVMEVDCPPPGYTNPLNRLERGMEKIQTVMKDDLDPDVMDLLLDVLQKRWLEMYRDMEARGDAVWRCYWAVWGVLEGQEAF